MEEEFSEENFEPDKYVKAHWSTTDDIRKLQNLKTHLQQLSDDTGQVIKRNVFENYSQFIKTAKDVIFLEDQMLQLTHLLRDQKSLIEQQMECQTSASKDSAGGIERNRSTTEDRRNTVQQLFDKIEGCAHLGEGTNRYVVFESDLTELNPDSMAPVRQVHAFLMNDSLIMTSWMQHKLGPMRYKYEAMYQLDSLNVKDHPSSKNTFKLTVFPENRMYQCENTKIKRKWLDAVELVKRQMLREDSLMRQATIRMRKERESLLPMETVPTNTSADNRVSTGDPENDNSEWLRLLPDELDVCIAQRDFEQAEEFIAEGREQLPECPDTTLVQEIRDKVNQKEAQLVDILCKELRSSGDQELQGGPKAARRAIRLLVKLGKASRASDLYLKNRGIIIKHSVREIKLTDVTVNYVEQLTKLVFTQLLDAGKDFTKLFSENQGCLAMLLVWASGELKNYVNQLLRHVFDPGPSLSVIGRSIQIARENCQHLADIGIDLEFELDKLLSPHVHRVIEQNRDNFLDALRMRIQEDKWKPNNLQSENNLAKYIEETREIGINIEPFVCEQPVSMKSPSKDRCWLWLTAQTCHFARSVVPLARDIALVRVTEQLKTADDAIVEVWRQELKHLETAPTGSVTQILVQRNAQFLKSQLLPLCEKRYKEAAKLKSWDLLSNLLKTEFQNLPGELEVVGNV